MEELFAHVVAETLAPSLRHSVPLNWISEKHRYTKEINKVKTTHQCGICDGRRKPHKKKYFI